MDRLALERKQGPGIVAAATDKPAAEATEGQVIDAWLKWYREALDSVAALTPGAPSERVQTAITDAKRTIR